MKIFFFQFLIIVNILFLNACTIAPLSSNHSAHTLEENAFSAQAGVAANGAFPYFRLGYGATQNLELGLLAENQESLSTGIFAKYGFINNKEKGTALSLESGLGHSRDDSTYIYIGPIVGYKTQHWDGYLGVRYSYVDGYYYDLFKKSEPIRATQRSNIQYGTVTLGNTVWLTKKFGLNFNANYLFGDIEGPYAGVGLVYVFKN